MERSSLPVNLGKLKKWYEDERQTLRCTLPFQRHSGAWTAYAKSCLVRSVLSDSYMPTILFLKDRDGQDEKGKDTYVYNIEDGQQRLTTMFSYMNDEWACHSATPPVEYDGVEYDLAGLKFSELPEELQSVINQYRFNIQCFEGYTMEEAETLFFNINNGVPLSQIQKAKSRMGTELISFFSELLQGDFFTQAVNITEAQARREDDLLMLIQGSLLLDNMLHGTEYKSISAANCLNYSAAIRGIYSNDTRSLLRDTIGYLNQSFTSGNKFLKKNNVPIVIVIAAIARESGVPAKEFRTFINEFANSIYPSYETASGSGNVKAKSVRMRLRVMFLALCRNFNLNPAVTSRPFAEDIPLYDGLVEDDGLLPETGGDISENAEVTPDPASVDGVSEGEEVSSDENAEDADDPAADVAGDGSDSEAGPEDEAQCEGTEEEPALEAEDTDAGAEEPADDADSDMEGAADV